MKGNYLKIFFGAIIAAGLVCLIAGIVIFFAVDGTAGIIVGIAFMMAGAADTIISVLIFIIILIKEKSDNNNQTHNKN